MSGRLLLLFLLSLGVSQFAACGGSDRTQKQRFNYSKTEDYAPVKPHRDAGGMMIAGTNTSESIRQLKSINGQSITNLEALMRPGNQDERSSKDGFLGANESLIEVMIADNDYVTERGLTHRELAIPLLQISNRAMKLVDVKQRVWTVDFEYAGTNWRVEMKVYSGFQFSPFTDGTKTNEDFEITNLDNASTLRFSGLVPIMIERYGFYEGHETPYRVDPSDIIRVLELNITEH